MAGQAVKPSPKAPPAQQLAREVRQIDAVAERLRQRMPKGCQVVYATGCLARLCGEYRMARDQTELAWRRLRAVAQAAQEDGRVALFQRRRTDGVTEYLAMGLERR